jgi:hypothetical protein
MLSNTEDKCEHTEQAVAKNQQGIALLTVKKPTYHVFHRPSNLDHYEDLEVDRQIAFS